MEGFKEFQGKSLDDAIREACRHFDTEREKLEIDILNDAKTGIFGLVGARKARIRARRMSFDHPVTEKRVRPSGLLSREEPAAKHAGSKKERDSKDSGKHVAKEAAKDTVKEQHRSERKVEKEAAPERAATVSEEPAAPHDQDGKSRSRSRRGSRGRRDGESRAESGRAEGSRPAEQAGNRDRRKPAQSDVSGDVKDVNRDAADVAGDEKDEGSQSRSRKRRPRPRRKNGGPRTDAQGRAGEGADFSPAAKNSADSAPAESDFDDNVDTFSGDDFNGDFASEVNLADLDQDKVLSLVQQTVEKLILPVIGEVKLAARIEDNRVKVAVDCGENSGLLIGREGQTLASFQYLANRIVAKEMGAPVRIQLDTGDYRERQDEKLRDLALHLADRAKNLGKPQSTRPLSSYHRRIVHLALQEDGGIQTRSKGEGPMKRVVILPRRKG